MFAFAAASLLAVRLWEVAIFAIWLIGFVAIVRSRDPLLIGVYVGATVTIFWDWICGSRYLFNIPHYDHRFLLHLWTIQGRTEPIWVAFAQGPFFALPSVLAVRWSWMRRHGDVLVYVLLGAAMGASDYVIEGISVGALHLYKYRYRSSSLFVGVPWEVLFVYVPICIAMTCVLVAWTSRLLELVGLRSAGVAATRSIDDRASLSSEAGVAFPELRGEASAEAPGAVATIAAPSPTVTVNPEPQSVPVEISAPSTRRTAFALGLAIPIAALYPGAWALALLNGAINPLA